MNVSQLTPIFKETYKNNKEGEPPVLSSTKDMVFNLFHKDMPHLQKFEETYFPLSVSVDFTEKIVDAVKNHLQIQEIDEKWFFIEDDNIAFSMVTNCKGECLQGEEIARYWENDMDIYMNYYWFSLNQLNHSIAYTKEDLQKFTKFRTK